MPNMISPAIRLIALLCNPSQLIIACDFPADNIENNSNGVPIPIPNSKKLIRLFMKDIVDVEIANSIARLAGLQGNTISPKNNPNRNASHNGFCCIGELNLGKNLPISTLKIIRILIIAKIPNAIGLIIPIA